MRECEVLHAHCGGSQPSLPQDTLKSFFPVEKGSPMVRLCCHTKAPPNSGHNTRPHPHVSSWPPRSPTIPAAAMENAVPWPCPAVLLPQWTHLPALPIPLLYSTFLASSCTLFSREQASPDLLCPSLPLPTPYSGSHAQPSLRAPGAREPEAPNLSPACWQPPPVQDMIPPGRGLTCLCLP